MDWTGLDRRAILGIAYHGIQIQYRIRVSTIIYHIFLLFPSLHSQFLVIYGISDKAGAYGPVGLGEHVIAYM
jgi:hypothetical protein